MRPQLELELDRLVDDGCPLVEDDEPPAAGYCYWCGEPLYDSLDLCDCCKAVLN